MTIIEVVLKFVRDRPERLNATCNQMNTLCGRLQSKKVPYCVWFIRRDVGQVLRKQETLHCACFGAPLDKGISSIWLAHPFMFFPDVLRKEPSLEISANDFFIFLCNGAKGFAFFKSSYL